MSSHGNLGFKEVELMSKDESRTNKCHYGEKIRNELLLRTEHPQVDGEGRKGPIQLAET